MTDAANTPRTAQRWAALNIPNPYPPDSVAWVAFENGQLAALEAIEAEASGSAGADRPEGQPPRIPRAEP